MLVLLLLLLLLRNSYWACLGLTVQVCAGGHDRHRLHHGTCVPHQQLPRGRGQPARGAASTLPWLPWRPGEALKARLCVLKPYL